MIGTALCVILGETDEAIYLFTVVCAIFIFDYARIIAQIHVIIQVNSLKNSFLMAMNTVFERD